MSDYVCIMSSQARTIPEDYDSDINYNNRQNLSKKISFKFKVEAHHREVPKYFLSAATCRFIISNICSEVNICSPVVAQAGILSDFRARLCLAGKTRVLTENMNYFS